MKILICLITMIIVANITGFGPTVCNAQLGGEAPLPEIKKPTGPSLEETKQWIAEKFPSILITDPETNTNAGSQTRYLVSFDDCEMTLSKVVAVKWPNHTVIHCSIYNMKLGEIDVDKISVKKFTTKTILSLESLGGLEIVNKIDLNGLTLSDIEILNKFPIKNDDVKSGYFSINGKKLHMSEPFPKSAHNLWLQFPEIGHAESMSNAFKHAVMLCQQKAAKDKAEQPPRKKELF